MKNKFLYVIIAFEILAALTVVMAGEGQEKTANSNDSVVATADPKGDSQGKVTCTNVPAGQVVVVVSPDKPGSVLPERVTLDLCNDASLVSGKDVTISSKLIDGKAVFKGIEPGTYQIMVEGNTNLPKNIFYEVAIKKGETLEIRVKTSSEVVSLHGKIIGENSQPLKDALIDLYFPMPLPTVCKQYGFSLSVNEQGEFTCNNLMPGKYSIWLFYGEDCTYIGIPAEVKSRDKNEIVINLGEGLKLSGQVLEADGTLASNIVLMIWGGGSGQTIDKKGKTDGFGNFSIPGLVDGEYKLHSIVDKVPFILCSGVKPGVKDMLIVVAPKQTVSFIVCDERGNPIADAKIFQDAVATGVKSGKDGTFELKMRSGGRYELVACTDRLVSKPITVDLSKKQDLTKSFSLILLRRDAVQTGL